MAFGAAAQVSLELVLEQDQFLPGEPVPVAARITNRSGRVLKMGENPDWLTFALESKDVSGGVVPKISEVPVEGEFSLPSSKRAVKRVDIAPHFAILKPGKYSVSATVHIPGWEYDITSAPVHFYVIEGTRIWEQEVGLPALGSNGAPEVRKYVLQQANHLRGAPKLYLRITDESGLHLFKLHIIGTILSFSRPDPQVDARSNLHVMYQSGPSSFNYQMISPGGEVMKRQTWDYYGDSRPRLKPDDEGNIVVVGGKRRLTWEDVPPNEAPAEVPMSVPTNSPVPAPGGTNP